MIFFNCIWEKSIFEQDVTCGCSRRCPTRVEPSIATKNHGLKEGFKWIVKSIIANMSDLGPRIDKDVEEEQQKEAERNELNLRQKYYQFSFHFYRYAILISCQFISFYYEIISNCIKGEPTVV